MHCHDERQIGEVQWPAGSDDHQHSECGGVSSASASASERATMPDEGRAATSSASTAALFCLVDVSSVAIGAISQTTC